MKASSLFLRTGILTAFVGIGLGTVMGVKEDFSLSPVHAHINLIGWVSMFLFGLYYRVTPSADNRLAVIQFGFSLIGLVLFAGGLTLVLLGHSEFGIPWFIGALCTVASMLIFGWTVFMTTRCTYTSQPAEVTGISTKAAA